jgi:hypothetical protein
MQDRDVFSATKTYLFKRVSRWRGNCVVNKKWFIADAVSGAIMFKSDRKETIQKFIRELKHHWEEYRGIWALRIYKNLELRAPHEIPNLSEKFIALIVEAKMRGHQPTTTYKELCKNKNKNN